MFSVSSERPCRNQKPSASTEAQSPCTQTPGMRDQYVSTNFSGSRQKPRVMPGNGLRQTSSPTSPVPTSDSPSSSTTSIAMPSAGPPTEHALIGPIGVGERKQAPTSVPPVQLITGTREPPTFSNSHRYGSGFHGSPVVTNVRKRREVGDGVAVRQERPCERRREAERGDALLLDRAPQPVGRRPVGRALREDDRAAERSDADERPRAHDPAHVGREVHHVARVHVGLVAGLSRDRRRGSRPARGRRPSAFPSCRRCT